jgi:hypothetical protein
MRNPPLLCKGCGIRLNAAGQCHDFYPFYIAQGLYVSDTLSAFASETDLHGDCFSFLPFLEMIPH